MQKYLFITIIIVLIVLSGCTGDTSDDDITTDDTPTDDVSTDDQNTEITPQQEYAINLNQAQSILNQAVQALDETICEQIELEDIKLSCGQKVMSTKALKYESERLCNKLLNEMERTGCLDSVYFKKANNEQDSSYCAKITNVNLKRTCEGNLR